jgi:predicted membrane-bound mannosyltransferase
MSVSTAQANEQPVALLAVSVETLLYLAVLAVAFVLHALRLGEPLLSEVEAPQAIAAYSLLKSGVGAPGIIDSPVTFASLVVSFAIAGTSTGAARFLPMVAGIGLVLSPLLFRDRLGPLPTLISTALLALSPSIVATSRLVGGYTFGMLALIVCVWAIDRHFRTGRARWVIIAGVALGITILSDYGMLAAVVAVLLGAVFAVVTDEEGDLQQHDLGAQLRLVPWRLFVIACLTTMLAVSTLFFLAPNGLAAAADILSRFGAGLFRAPRVFLDGLYVQHL